MPNHVAIILDGNRRWAKRNLTLQNKGHFKGADTVENLLDWCEEFDIKIINRCLYVTYGFRVAQIGHFSQKVSELLLENYGRKKSPRKPTYKRRNCTASIERPTNDKS